LNKIGTSPDGGEPKFIGGIEPMPLDGIVDEPPGEPLGMLELPAVPAPLGLPAPPAGEVPLDEPGAVDPPGADEPGAVLPGPIVPAGVAVCASAAAALRTNASMAANTVIRFIVSLL
jgi:hypothetical protein